MKHVSLLHDMPVHCLLDSFWFWSRLSLGDGVMEIHANEFPRGGSGSNNYWISSGQGRFGKYQTIFPSFCKMLILLFPNSWFGCMDLSSWIFLFLYTLTENVVDRSGEWREIWSSTSEWWLSMSCISDNAVW